MEINTYFGLVCLILFCLSGGERCGPTDINELSMLCLLLPGGYNALPGTRSPEIAENSVMLKHVSFISQGSQSDHEPEEFPEDRP